MVAKATVLSTSASEARIDTARSTATLRSISAGRTCLNLGINAFTRSTVPIMFAPGWRVITSATAG